MTKVVINRCYGGFGLSPAAVKRFAELNGRECYLFTHAPGNLYAHIPATVESLKNSLFFTAFDIPNPDEVLGTQKDWHTWSEAEKKASNEAWEIHSIPTGREIDRTDPILIRVIEELGEKADGDCAELKIVEIPDGVDYEIDEYDGIETIHEKHRSWA